jgi:hypothetical protein
MLQCGQTFRNVVHHPRPHFPLILQPNQRGVAEFMVSTFASPYPSWGAAEFRFRVAEFVVSGAMRPISFTLSFSVAT